MKFLNIGCGRDIRRDKNPDVEWINLDRTKPADVIADLEEPLPFKDNTFKLVFAHSILEHIRNYTQLQSEIYRVLEPHGQLQAHVPDYTSPDAYGDPDHVRMFSFHSFYTMYWYGMIVKDLRHYTINNPKGISTNFPELQIAPHLWIHATLVKLTPSELMDGLKMGLWDQKMGCWQPEHTK